jgi:FtsP/CotA-like multicopper oxidase with cupredoxin domain
MRKGTWKWVTIAAALALLTAGFGTGAWAQVVQTPLKSNSLPQFVDPLPDLNALPAQTPVNPNTIETIVAGTGEISLTMEEFKANVMPTGFVPAAGAYTGTWVWGYRNVLTGGVTQNTYTGPAIVATKGTPTQIRFTNNLGLTATSNLLAYTQSTDQTLHWANPLGLPMTTMTHYQGPIPAVPHLHGGEVPPWIDGGPDAWFLSSTTTPSGYAQHGPQYYSMAGAALNEAIYRYPNNQEPANIWFHDHTLGATRLNVYAGIAGAYPIVDPALTFYNSLPAPIVPLVIQDRMFDTNGQLFFPNVGLNPLIHPFWVPEFIGDTILVNGKVWPFMNVAPQRYRFFVLNGSNARTYDLSLSNVGGKVAPAMWQIGTDGGYLDFPVQVGTKAVPLVLQPGERADLIIDFTGLPVGTVLTLTNTAKAPYPAGAPPKGSTTGSVMQFKVVAADLNGRTPGTFVPSATAALRGGAGQAPVINRLPGVPAGVAPATPAGPALVLPGQPGTPNVQVYRQLTLNEIMGPGGPQEILVNNTKWTGKRPDGSVINGAVIQDAAGNWITEFPKEGDTEVWDIINTTADTHPIHTHLTQFQLVSRQDFGLKGYLAVYGAAFPGGSGIDMVTGMNMIYPAMVYTPGFGPPLNYSTPQTSLVSGATFIGGNPDVTPFLNIKKAALPPAPNEMGWKDTIQAPPGQVTRIVVRFSPINSAAGTTYAFDPSGADYVWHCHIIDHEDNEMMRPYQVNPKAGATRTYVKGTDY